MSVFHRRPFGVLLFVCLALSLCLVSCAPAKEQEATNTSLAHEFLGYAQEENEEAAFSMVADICDRAQFLTVWEPMCAALRGTEYELTVVEQSRTRSGGRTVTTVAYHGETQEGAVFYLRISTVEGETGIAGMGFNDATDFLAATSYVRYVDIALLILSALFLAFEIWMLVDCLRRPIPRRGLWVLLIVISLGISFAFGTETFSLQLAGGLLLPLSRMTADVASSVVRLRLLIPFGAVAYFFLRRRLTAEAAATDTANTDPS